MIVTVFRQLLKLIAACLALVFIYWHWISLSSILISTLSGISMTVDAKSGKLLAQILARGTPQIPFRKYILRQIQVVGDVRIFKGRMTAAFQILHA